MRVYTWMIDRLCDVLMVTFQAVAWYEQRQDQKKWEAEVQWVVWEAESYTRRSAQRVIR